MAHVSPVPQPPLPLKELCALSRVFGAVASTTLTWLMFPRALSGFAGGSASVPGSHSCLPGEGPALLVFLLAFSSSFPEGERGSQLTLSPVLVSAPVELGNSQAYLHPRQDDRHCGEPIGQLLGVSLAFPF